MWSAASWPARRGEEGKILEKRANAPIAKQTFHLVGVRGIRSGKARPFPLQQIVRNHKTN